MCVIFVWFSLPHCVYLTANLHVFTCIAPSLTPGLAGDQVPPLLLLLFFPHPTPPHRSSSGFPIKPTTSSYTQEKEGMTQSPPPGPSIT